MQIVVQSSKRGADSGLEEGSTLLIGMITAQEGAQSTQDLWAKVFNIYYVHWLDINDSLKGFPE